MPEDLTIEPLMLAGNASIVFVNDGSEGWAGIPGERPRQPWDDATPTAQDNYLGGWPNPTTLEAIRQADEDENLTNFKDLDAFRRHLDSL